MLSMMQPRDSCFTLLLVWLGVYHWSLSSNTVKAFVVVVPSQNVVPSTDRISPALRLFSSATREESEKTKENYWKEGGRIRVEVCEHISFPPGSFSKKDMDPLTAASERVREAWMEHHWRRGGGLPIFVLQPRGESGEKRIVAPVLMEESLSPQPSKFSDGSDAFSPVELEYKVTSPGPFFGPDLVPGSHTGRVAFESTYVPGSEPGNEEETSSAAIATSLVWRVEFDALRFRSLYQGVTEFTIGTAARTVREAVSTPRLLTVQTRLTLAPSTSQINSQDGPAQAARRVWLDFLFSSIGGGLPLPPPVPFGNVLEEGGGLARKKLFRFPPGLTETAMVPGPSGGSGDESDDAESSMAYYKLENPGWWTLPFLVHTHLGCARFRTIASDAVELTWDVEIRPYLWTAPLVEKLTEATVSTIAKNLCVELEDPGARVAIRPPRGGRGGEPLGSVPKATWVGRVLEAHTSDKRSVWEQSISLLMPWTWGEDSSQSSNDGVSIVWSDGTIT